MSRYDGLIIPRSYSEYINKTDAATLLQALQLSGVMDNVPTAGSNHPVKSGGIYSAITTPQSGTVTSDYSYYYNSLNKIGNIVNLRLELYSGREVIAANTTKFLGNIPAGFRPNNRLGIEVGNCNAGNGRLVEMWHCDISTTGDLILYTGNTALDFAYINAMYII